MRPRAPAAARQRFHRFVAVLFATTVPLIAAVELVRALEGGPGAWLRLVGPTLLTVWAIAISRRDIPNSLPLVLGTMVFTAVTVMLELPFMVDLTSFDFATAFGLIMLLSVLAGTLTQGSRLVWAGGLAAANAAWVATVGILLAEPASVIGTRVVIAVAGVVFTIALVAELYDNLTAATSAHDRATRLQEAVARCSEALLVHPDSFALHEAVRAVFEATEADYAYIDRTIDVDGEPGWEIVASAESGVSQYGNGWKQGSYSSIPTTFARLRSGKSSVINTTELTGAERQLYEGDGIYSEVCIPIFIGEEFRGSIGFVEYTDDRQWSDAEIQTLWRAADMVGAYWRRQDDAEALRASNDSKDKLLASVSHEIRTPLTAIVGLSEEISSNGASLGLEVIDELNSIIAVQSRELAELVEDLLVASRADFGNLSIRPERIDLGEQVEMVLRGVRESSPASKTVVFEPAETSAWADPLRVRQVIRNLVTNAIKYGGDEVVVALGSDGERATVTVSDDGPGVPEGEASLIFERYYRSSESPTQPGSVGIGLAVSRQLAEMMDGTLEYAGGDQPSFRLSLPAMDTGLEDEALGVLGFATPG